MNKNTAFPFLVLPDNAISSINVLLGDRDEPLEEASHLFENWDYARDLEVKVNIDVDFDVAASSLKIPIEELQLLVVLKIGTGSGNMPRNIQIYDKSIFTRGCYSAALSAILESSKLSGRLCIDCSILLECSSSRCESVSPQKKGLRLWHTQRDILIEDGGASRFPIETIDFTRSFSGRPHAFSPWYFDWRPDCWGMDFAANTRLYINSNFPKVIERVAAADPLTLTVILNDVMNQMISALTFDEGREENLADCAEGSVGHQVMNWKEVAFPDMSWGAIDALREHRPGEFNAAILSAAQVGEEL
jgi:hypothetical protein